MDNPMMSALFEISTPTYLLTRALEELTFAAGNVNTKEIAQLVMDLMALTLLKLED